MTWQICVTHEQRARNDKGCLFGADGRRCVVVSRLLVDPDAPELLLNDSEQVTLHDTHPMPAGRYKFIKGA